MTGEEEVKKTNNIHWDSSEVLVARCDRENIYLSLSGKKEKVRRKWFMYCVHTMQYARRAQEHTVGWILNQFVYERYYKQSFSFSLVKYFNVDIRTPIFWTERCFSILSNLFL